MATRGGGRHTPKIITCLREGYGSRNFAADLSAGLTVAVIALPLAMALGIASIPQSVADDLRAIHPWLTPPAMGLFTAAIAGIVVSTLGGSRVQIGGPTAAFVPIVFGIAATHGYQGLALATVMAGVIVILMGLFRFGALIKFIPYPVTTGFTAGIAVVLLTSQIKDFLGLSLLAPDGSPLSIPPDFVPKLQQLASHIHTISPESAGIGFGSIAILILLRRVMPRIPGAVVAVVLASVVVWAMGWSDALSIDGAPARPIVETIGSRFGGIPTSLPKPHLPPVSFQMVRELIPSATTIAILCAIESLLSAVVADGMTGFRHRSDQELIAQGTANIASALFFGLPATGAIARTTANIKSGGRTPIAGIIHAVAILVAMLILAPVARLIPLPTLAAILIVVAWNIAEIDHFRTLLRSPRQDVLVLLTTFGLTVFTDLTIGVGVGMVLASFLFMKRMAEVSRFAGIHERENDDQEPTYVDPKDPGKLFDKTIPPGVEIFEINGPFFFGIADRLMDIASQFERPPAVFILRMRYVPHIDATAMHALEEFLIKCKRQGTVLLLGGVHVQPLFELTRSGFMDRIGQDAIFDDLDSALERAKALIEAKDNPDEPDPNP
jgi:sulfate permease, SulP family